MVELDLGAVVPCCSGPKRPQDRIPVSDMKEDFESCLGAKVGNDPPHQEGSHMWAQEDTPPLSLCPPLLCSQQGFKGFQVAAEQHAAAVPFHFGGGQYTLGHGSVVIAAITSCTNTSNPSVMLGAGGCRDTVRKLSRPGLSSGPLSPQGSWPRRRCSAA